MGLPSLLDCLRLDMRVAPLPDVGGNSDYQHIYSNADPKLELESYSEVHVPDAWDGRRIGMLGIESRCLLAKAVGPLRRTVDAWLSQNVYGYREGVLSSYTRRDDYSRYRSQIELLTKAGGVLSVDIADSHRSITREMIARSLRNMQVPGVDSSALWYILDRLQTIGAPIVVRGIADSAFLLNIALHSVDALVNRPFTRWGDDYTIGTTEPDLDETIRRFEAGLAELGLTLNAAKTRWAPPATAPGVWAWRPFLRESAGKKDWIESLRTAHSGHNAALARHALRRLRDFELSTEDVAAVCDCLDRRGPDLPRALYALHGFEGLNVVRSAASRALAGALAADDWWAAGWLAAYSCHIHVNLDLDDRVITALRTEECPAHVGGLLLRLWAGWNTTQDVSMLARERDGRIDRRGLEAALRDSREPPGIRSGSLPSLATDL